MLGTDAAWTLQPPSAGASAAGRVVQGSMAELQVPTDFAGAEDEELVLGDGWDM